MEREAHREHHKRVEALMEEHLARLPEDVAEAFLEERARFARQREHIERGDPNWREA